MASVMMLSDPVVVAPEAYDFKFVFACVWSNKDLIQYGSRIRKRLQVGYKNLL